MVDLQQQLLLLRGGKAQRLTLIVRIAYNPQSPHGPTRCRVQPSQVGMDVPTPLAYHGLPQHGPHARMSRIGAVPFALPLHGPRRRLTQRVIPKGTLEGRKLIRTRCAHEMSHVASKRPRQRQIEWGRTQKETEHSTDPETAGHPADALAIRGKEPFS